MSQMFFTRIKNPNTFRKTVLESSKEIISVLKDYQILLRMRQEKESKINHLKEQFNELNTLLEKIEKFVPEESMKELEEMLPKPKPKPEPKPAPKKKKATKKKSTKKKVAKKAEPEEVKEPEREPTELEKLEHALSKIDDKLNKI